MRRLELSHASVDLDSGEVTGPRPSRLTQRELALLRFLSERPGEVVERDTLLRDVFGYAPTVASRAVDKAMDSLRGKVEADKANPKHLLGIFGVGYRFVPSEPRAAALVDRFVGREAELAALSAPRGPGLVTVLGPGGAGKTRLVREACGANVRFCDLAPCRTDSEVIGEIERAVGVIPKDPGLAERAALVAERAAKTGDPLVLDNAEHVLDAVRTVAPTLGSRVPVVVTSRVRLEIPGERVVDVGPLPVSAAVELFRDRAGAVEADPADVAAIVELVDRLPLAIELAARRARLLPPRELRQRLARGHALLSTTSGGLPERHRDVRHTVAWSWALLPPALQDALCQLTVFVGGFDLDAASAVLDLPAEGAAEVLQALLDASLLRRAPSGRLDLYETVRSYARGEAQDVRAAAARHGAWFAAWGARQAIAVRREPDALGRLAEELPNLRAVYAVGSGAEQVHRVQARLAVQAWARVRGHVQERRSLVEGALADSEGLEHEARVLVLQARAVMDAYRSVEPDPRLLAEAEALAVRLERPDLLAGILVDRAMSERMQGRAEAAQALLARAAAIPQHDPWVTVNLRYEEGVLEVERTHHAQDALLVRALDFARAHGFGALEAMGRIGLARVRQDRQQIVEAEREYRRGLELGLALQSPRIAGLAAFSLAVLAREDGRWDEAREWADRAHGFGAEQGDAFILAGAELALAMIALHEGRDADAEAHGAAGLATGSVTAPGRDLLVLTRAVALARLGRPDEARRELVGQNARLGEPFLEPVTEARPFVEFLVASRAGEAAVPPELRPLADGWVRFFADLARTEGARRT